MYGCAHDCKEDDVVVCPVGLDGKELEPKIFNILNP
jgi:hypothetical protein